MRALFVFFLVFPSGIALGADCTPTPGRTIGTHYDLSRATHQPGDVGQGFMIQGRVLSAADCRPLPGVRIVHWQAGEQGRYLDRFYAWRLSDAGGAYRFETEWPALQPPHIHFLVEAPGHRPLATQWIADERVSAAQFDLVLEPVSD